MNYYQKLFNSILVKLVVSMMGSVLLIIGVLTFIIAQNATNLWEDQSKRQLAQQLDQNVEIVANFMNTRKTNVDLWASKFLDDISTSYPGLATVVYFSNIKQKEPWIEDIFFIKPGNLIYSSSGTFDSTKDDYTGPIGLIDLLKQPLSDFSPVKLITSHDAKDRDVLLLKRQLSRNGVPVEGNYIILLLNFQKVNEWLFEGRGVGKHGFFSLISFTASGKLFIPELEVEGAEKSDFFEISPQWENLSNIPDRYNSILLDQRKIAQYPFGIIGVASLNDVKDPVFRIIVTSVLWGTFISVISLFGVFIIATSLTSPVRKLTEQVQKFSSLTASPDGLSNLPEQQFFTAELGNDEIGVLNVAFQKLGKEIIERDRKISEHIDALNKLNEDLTSANRLKDEFLANISHELRTPLHGIIGITESMISDVPAHLTPHQQDNLSIVVSSARRLNNLVNDILDSSMLKHRKLKLQKTSVNMHEVTNVVLSLFQYMIGKKDVKLVNAIPDGVPAVDADENRVQQIMHNLVGNAIKFTESGSIEISAVAQEKHLEICVSDTGIGISLEKQANIFEFFIQADGSISRKYGGSGLGLAITKQLLELHCGTIRVDSEEGKGAVFAFTLPLCEKNIKPGPVISQVVHYPGNPPVELSNTPVNYPPSTEKNFHVLVVDDDPVNLQVMMNYLAGKNYVITQATDGVEALEIIRTSRLPDLILLDVMMPHMSGFELCQKVRERFPAHEVPIIFLTAKNQVSDLVQGFALGGNDYLAKPFSKDELLARIHNQIQLLQAKDQLISLRNFSNRIAEFKNTTQIMESAFEELCHHVYTDDAILYQEEKLLNVHPQKGSHTSLLIDEKLVEQFLSLEKKEILVFNTIEESNPLYRIFKEKNLTGAHIILIRIANLENYLICLFRSPNSMIFNSADIEYIRNIINQIKVTRGNIQTFISDDKLLSSVNQVNQILKRVLYIHAQSPYCLVTLDSQSKDVIEFRLTLQNLTTYFGEDSLLQVHRSYLINPQKIVSMRRKPSSTYEIVLRNLQHADVCVPVGRLYIEKIRKICGQNSS